MFVNEGSICEENRDYFIPEWNFFRSQYLWTEHDLCDRTRIPPGSVYNVKEAEHEHAAGEFVKVTDSTRAQTETKKLLVFSSKC